MLRIKLSRKGKKNQPFFRLIVLERAKDTRGDFLEDLGFYNPLTKQASFKEERIKHWISKGAEPTGSVHNLLVTHGIIKADKVRVTKMNKKKQKAKEETKEQKSENKEKSKQKAEENPLQKPEEANK